MEVEPHEPNWTENTPREDHEEQGICKKAKQRAPAHNQPSQRLSAKEYENALRTAQVLTHLAN